MNIRTSILFLAVLAALLGCGSVESSSWSSGGAGGTGGGGGAGGQGNYVCAPTSGYDPASAPIGPLVPLDVQLAGIVASVLPPFVSTTTCQTVIVGFVIGPAPCELPSAIDVVTFDTLDPLSPTTPALYAIVPLTEAALYPTPTPTVFEVRLHLQTSHAPGLHPFVGAMVRSNFCPAVMPLCEGEPENAMRYKPEAPSKGWHPLSQTLPGSPGTSGALYFGFADCTETG